MHRVALILLIFTLTACATFETGPEVSDTEQQQAAAILQQKAELYRAQQKQRFIEIGVKLLEQADNPPTFTFELKESDEINAYAGYTEDGRRIIEVTRGMLRFVKNDDELAVILGHELAHLTKEHNEKKQDMVGLWTGLGVIAGAVAGGLEGAQAGSDIGGAVGEGVALSYSQDMEREADYAGLTYAYKAGFNPEAGIKVWERMAIEFPQTIEKKGSLLSTHPSSPERMIRMAKIVEDLKKGTRVKNEEVEKTIEKLPIEKSYGEEISKTVRIIDVRIATTTDERKGIFWTLHNIGKSPISNAEITLYYYDSSGAIVYTEKVLMSQISLLPGQKKKWGAYLKEKPKMNKVIASVTKIDFSR